MSYTESFGGKLTSYRGGFTSITRLEPESARRSSRRQQLAARVEAAREDERAALARELHDELGQTLTAVKLELGRTTAALRTDRVSPDSVDRLQSLVGLIEIGIETVKRIATELRPPVLDHLGLPDAIQWEAMAFRARTGLRCHAHIKKEGTALTKDQQIVLFRIFQEALTNVVRHAQASAVHVTLIERPRAFALRIRDNGGGIPERRIRDPRSIGLQGMRERAALIGATFAIKGLRGKGTTIEVRVPILPIKRGALSNGRDTH